MMDWKEIVLNASAIFALLGSIITVVYFLLKLTLKEEFCTKKDCDKKHQEQTADCEKRHADEHCICAQKHTQADQVFNEYRNGVSQDIREIKDIIVRVEQRLYTFIDRFVSSKTENK